MRSNSVSDIFLWSSRIRLTTSGGVPLAVSNCNWLSEKERSCSFPTSLDSTAAKYLSRNFWQSPGTATLLLHPEQNDAKNNPSIATYTALLRLVMRFPHFDNVILPQHRSSGLLKGFISDRILLRFAQSGFCKGIKCLTADARSPTGDNRDLVLQIF